MKKIDAFADKLFGVMVRISSIFLIFIMFFVFINVILRLVFKAPVLGSTEIVRYAALTGAAFALTQNEWYDGNIRVTMLLEPLPAKVASVISFVGYLLITGGIGMIVYFLGQQTMKYYGSGTLTNELALPLYIFYAILAFGFLMLMVCFAFKTIIFGYKAFGKNVDPKFGIHKAPLE